MIIDTDKLRAAIAEHFAGIRVTDEEVASEPAALLTQVRQDHHRAEAIAITERVESLALYYEPEPAGTSPDDLDKLRDQYAARYGSGLRPLEAK